MPKGASDAALASVRAFADGHDPDSGHAAQVCALSLELFDALADIHGLGSRERLLLEAAALMHDTGYDRNPMNHQKGSRKLILGAKLDGFTRKELMIMACAARYHGKREPRPSDKVYRDLGEGDQSRVAKLAALLRIADGLDRSHTSSVQGLRIDRAGGVVHIYVRQDGPNPMDLAGALRKGGLFERVFGVTLEITAGEGVKEPTA